MNKIKKEKGFTIIEVVLVLAIAGLIFLMVFIALPSLQKSQRDAQRKSDLSRIQTQITAYANNNRGAVPSSLITTSGTPSRSFVQKYLSGASASVSGTDFADPATGSGYTFLAAGNAPAVFAAGSSAQIGYQAGRVCGTDGTFTATGASARSYALLIALESQSTPFCLDTR
jgi:prepilin-type N-terminal cleavage/methylation domain-containing protein